MPNPTLEYASSPLGWAVIARRRWRLLVALPLVAAAVATGVSLLRGPDFVAQSRLSPEQPGGSRMQLGGLVSQLGIASSLGGSTENLRFYAEVLRSADLLRATVEHPLGAEAGAATLLDVHGGEAVGPARVGAAVYALNKRMNIGLEPESNLLTLRTRGRTRELAVATNRALLTQLDVFNRERRQSRAGAERQFLEERLAETSAELAEAEAALAGYIESNRRFEESAATSLQVEQLRRRVVLANTKYLSLTESFEQARLDEVRNTPVITVIEDPAGTVHSTGRYRRDGLFGLLIGFLLAVGLIASGEYLKRARAERPELFEELNGRHRVDPVPAGVPAAVSSPARTVSPHPEGSVHAQH
jgi:hypothetical protein